MTLEEYENYFLERSYELLNICNDGTPWVFLCASALIEYLAKLVNGKDLSGEGYKNFITEYMAEIKNEYKTFRYKNGEEDLPTQMYHILRCGIIHSFSFISDDKSKNKGGRDRSLVLSHRKSGNIHLSAYSSSNVSDSVNFVAEDFIDDIQKTIRHIFLKAKSDTKLAENIINWLKLHPPIMANI